MGKKCLWSGYFSQWAESGPYTFIFILFLLDKVQICKDMKAKKMDRNVHVLSYSKTSLFQTLYFDDLKYKCDSVLLYLLKKVSQLKNN